LDKFTLASGSYETIKIWDIKSTNCLKTIVLAHLETVYDLLMLSESKLISGGASMKIWDLKTGICLKVFNKKDFTCVKDFIKLIKSKVACRFGNKLTICDTLTGKFEITAIIANCITKVNNYLIAILLFKNIKILDSQSLNCLYLITQNTDFYFILNINNTKIACSRLETVEILDCLKEDYKVELLS